MSTLYRIENLSIAFHQYHGLFKQVWHEKVSQVNLSIQKGEILAIVGASGSGKTLLAHCLLGILPSNAAWQGQLYYRGQAIDSHDLNQLRSQKLSFIAQSIHALDPLLTIGQHIQLAQPASQKSAELYQALKRYKLSPDVLTLYPYQLSGGMARRIMVMMAFLSQPEMIIADEPSPGMDQEAIEETIRLLVENKDQNLTSLLILHDLELALELADRIAVFQEGRIVDLFQTEEQSDQDKAKRHPYTRALFNARPSSPFFAQQLKED